MLVACQVYFAIMATLATLVDAMNLILVHRCLLDVKATTRGSIHRDDMSTCDIPVFFVTVETDGARSCLEVEHGYGV
jgi:hypothetical protein